jgi:hypothetical protein
MSARSRAHPWWGPRVPHAALVPVPSPPQTSWGATPIDVEASISRAYELIHRQRAAAFDGLLRMFGLPLDALE